MRRTVLIALLACAPAFAGPAPESQSWLTPLTAAEWDVAKAAHLLSRAGFGGTPEQILRTSMLEPSAAVASLVDYESLPQVDPLKVPAFDLEAAKKSRQASGLARRHRKQIADQYLYYLKAALDRAIEGKPAIDPRMSKRLSKLSPEQRKRYMEKLAKRQKKLTETKGPRGLEYRLRLGERLSEPQLAELVAYRVENDLRQRHLQQYVQWVRNWWLARMVRTQRPLEEKMVLFWHGHFATSYATVRNGYAMEAQNQMLRKHAVGDFGAMVKAVQRDAAMLRYLDGDKNVRGKPNENFAREVMELFTLGKGNYTEQDIKEAARAFTGWGFEKKKGRTKYGTMPTVAFRSRMHDGGEKTFFGISGKHKADDIIRIILAHPQCSRYIVGKLFFFFVGSQPDTATRESLARTFRESGYQIKPVLSRIFSARGFYGSDVVGKGIKSPTELVVGTLRQLRPSDQQLEATAGNVLLSYANRAMGQMGQALFYPPNVKGWDGGRSWINSATMLSRYNMPADLLAGLSGQTRQLKARYYKKQRKSKRSRKAPASPTDLGLITQLAELGSVDAVLSHLQKRFLRVPLAPERRAKVRAALMSDMLEGEPFDPQDVTDRKRLLTAVLLITSMPEYQLS